MKIKNYIFYFILFILSFLGNAKNVNCAEKITFYHGIMSRSISINKLEEFAKTNKATGTIKNLIKLANEDEDKISTFLNQEYEMPIVITSKLMNSKIGTVIIKRVSKFIYPDKTNDSKISILAIRSGVIQGIYIGEGKINLIRFLKSYPNKNIAINLASLNEVIYKAESMNDLVEFFTNEPFEKLKKPSSNS
tara:strand:- start:11958 stop:12533 length:576 start_codon:yes stop_codon:yes gene_type:complete